MRVSEAEFWPLSLYEFRLLVKRYEKDVRFRAKCAGAVFEEDDTSSQYLTPEQLAASFRRTAVKHGRPH